MSRDSPAGAFCRLRVKGSLFGSYTLMIKILGYVDPTCTSSTGSVCENTGGSFSGKKSPLDMIEIELFYLVKMVHAPCSLKNHIPF